MNFFGNNGCCDNREYGCGGGFDCCSLIFLILLLQNCGCGGGFGGKGGEICIDCKTLLFLILLSNCGCGCSHDCK